MTLIKSTLLGSAAGILAVAGAQAADLPTHKAAPVIEYVRICNVGGITGWTLPGSDTCVKLSGYITAQFTGGNLDTQYNWGGAVANSLLATNTLFPNQTVFTSQRILVAGTDRPVPIIWGPTGALTGLVLPNQANAVWNRHAIGWTTRANFGFDFASNTAYGPLIGHFDINSETGNGFDNTGTATYLNTGYLTWAGITAGKAQSFFSFIGGGDNWANIFSPDRKGFNEPNLLAYTASFGGGFSATISAESQGSVGSSGGGTDITQGSLTYGGQRWPDFVGALHYKSGWGEAQLSGVIHDVNVRDTSFYGNTGCGIFVTPFLGCNASEGKVGWALDAGVKVNLNWWGAGDSFLVTGAYSQNAVWYSGLLDGMWGENGQVNGNGQPMYLSDAFFNPVTNTWSQPRAWSVTGIFEHHFTPAFYVDLEGSVGGINWSNQGGGCNFNGFGGFGGFGGCGIGGFGFGQFGTGALSSHATSWIIGTDIGWMPVTNLNFDLELMYQSTQQDRPSGFLGTVFGNGVFTPFAGWQGESNGFAGRFRITRYF
jgi:Porin subfamily